MAVHFLIFGSSIWNLYFPQFWFLCVVPIKFMNVHLKSFVSTRRTVHFDLRPFTFWIIKSILAWPSKTPFSHSDPSQKLINYDENEPQTYHDYKWSFSYAKYECHAYWYLISGSYTRLISFFGEFLESLDSEKYEFTTGYFIFGYRWLLLYYQTQSTTTSTCNTS